MNTNIITEGYVKYDCTFIKEVSLSRWNWLWEYFDSLTGYRPVLYLRERHWRNSGITGIALCFGRKLRP